MRRGGLPAIMLIMSVLIVLLLFSTYAGLCMRPLPRLSEWPTMFSGSRVAALRTCQTGVALAITILVAALCVVTYFALKDTIEKRRVKKRGWRL